MYVYRERGKSGDLEINVGARVEEVVEFGIFLDILPLSGAVLRYSGTQRFFFLRRPFLLWIPHPSLSQLLKPSSSLNPRNL